jgi:predicted aconitase
VGAWVKYVFGLLWKAICALPKIFSGGLATVEADFKAVGAAIKTTGTVIVDDVEGKTPPPVPTLTTPAATTTTPPAPPVA